MGGSDASLGTFQYGLISAGCAAEGGGFVTVAEDMLIYAATYAHLPVPSHGLHRHWEKWGSGWEK
jgi:hypothetical protein